uniref:Immunoglobulin V-set domain-containing protein n=1 Tax=Neolamprologus brichardi TaxID=32507 RepID=A0A3Q4GHZ7_NEOBR
GLCVFVQTNYDKCIWYNKDNQVICHSDKSQTSGQFRNRTKLLGDLSKKNCSLMIDDLQQSDVGPLYFRIEIKGYDQYSYKSNKVSVSVKEVTHIHFLLLEKLFPQTFTGIWYNDNDQVVCHSDASQTLDQFRNRTKLLGDLSKKNCSLMIDDLQQSDGGTFYFRIEITDYDKYSYKNNKVSISVSM